MYPNFNFIIMMKKILFKFPNRFVLSIINCFLIHEWNVEAYDFIFIFSITLICQKLWYLEYLYQVFKIIPISGFKNRLILIIIFWKLLTTDESR